MEYFFIFVIESLRIIKIISDPHFYLISSIL